MDSEENNRCPTRDSTYSESRSPLSGLNHYRVKRKLRILKKDMDRATQYSEWRALASQYDKLSGMRDWRFREKSRLYGHGEIRHRYSRINALLERGDAHEILHTLNEGIHGNMDGMGNPTLYGRSKLGTKVLIERYIDLVAVAVDRIADAGPTEIPANEKLDFFRRASHCFGRSALLMSGAGGLLYFHHGVVSSLIEHKLLPKVLSGSSGGAWVCGHIGIRDDKELCAKYFADYRYPDPDWDRDRVFHGAYPRDRAFRERSREEMIDNFCPSITFQEAYEHSGRYVNITIAPAERHQKARLLNAITSPNVTVRSALMATSAVPGIVSPVRLEAKNSQGRLTPYLPSRRWVDGAATHDIPLRQISRLFGVNHTVVSLANPAVLPFARASKSDSINLKNSAYVVATTFLKESTKNIERYLATISHGKRPHYYLENLNRLLRQQYTGDVNIVLESKHYRLKNALFRYEEEDIENLIMIGKRLTWPKIDMLDNATKIGRRIERWLVECDSPPDMQNQHITI